MKTLSPRLTLAALTLSLVAPPAVARAGHHQICYEAVAPGPGMLGVNLACRSDDPAISCRFIVPRGWTLVASSSAKGSNERRATYARRRTTASCPDAHVLGLPLRVTIAGTVWEVKSAIVSETSAEEESPSIVAAGPGAGYALTSVGARVRTSFGAGDAFLWKLRPRTDVWGVEAGATNHGLKAWSEVTGYAVGVKLVVC